MRDALRREIEREEHDATGVLLDVIASTEGRSGGWRGNRDELYDRRSFIDTNVLEYAGDDDNPTRQHIARRLIVTPEIINRAVDGSILWQVSFWDALVLACAEDAACTVVFSEDLNSGQRYGGVRVENPFADPHAP